MCILDLRIFQSRIEPVSDQLNVDSMFLPGIFWKPIYQLSQVESYLKGTAMKGLASARTMARRRPI